MKTTIIRHLYVGICVIAVSTIFLIIGCVSHNTTAPDQPPPPTSHVSSILRKSWILSSRPVEINDSLSERGRLAWYQPINPYPAFEVWDTELPPGVTNLAYTLTMEYCPVDFIRVKDTINGIIDSVSYNIAPELSWNGVTARLPYKTAFAFENASYLDIRLRGDAGVMRIDLGWISEDINGDNRLNTEDLYRTGILEDSLDYGLDGLADHLEFGYDPDNGVYDPAGDNFDLNDTWHINGTENNRDDPDGGYIPDTEDRNLNGFERANDYFSYRIDLSDNRSYYVPQSRNDYGWKTIRLPIGEPGLSDTEIGSPKWNEIYFFRIWFDSVPALYMDNSLKVELADFNLDIKYDTITPPSSIVTRIVKDVDYLQRTFYDLGRLPMVRSRSDTLLEPDKYDFMYGDSILRAVVYLDDNNPDPNIRLLRPQAMMYVDPEDTLSDDPTGYYKTHAFVEPINEIDYYVNPTHFYIQFLRPIIGSDDVVGVYMEVLRTDGSIDTIGDISSQPYRLKLIKPQYYSDVNHHVWEYEWKNVYWLGGYNLDLGAIDIEIYKGAPLNDTVIDPNDLNHQEGIFYIQILGLDQGDDFGNGQPDGKVDLSVHIDFLMGLLVFPSRHPFDSRFGYVYDSASGDSTYLIDSVPEIYNSASANLEIASKYYIRVSRRVYP